MKEKKDAELSNLVAEQKLRTQRILGELIKNGQDSGEIRKQAEHHETSTAKELVEVGLTKKQSSAFKAIAEIPEETFEEFIQEKKEAVNSAVKEYTKISYFGNMSSDEYLQWSLTDRASMLWDKGTYLETTVYYGYTVKLYSLHSFFVEVYYSPEKEFIEKIVVAEMDDLKKYLGQISINLLR
jgi:hypothetical protein